MQVVCVCGGGCNSMSVDCEDILKYYGTSTCGMPTADATHGPEWGGGIKRCCQTNHGYVEVLE